MEKFKCEKCDNLFETDGEVLEYHSPVYGPCSKKVAACPRCGSKSDEYRPPKQSKAKSDFRQGAPAMGSCPAGGCCRAGQS